MEKERQMYLVVVDNIVYQYYETEKTIGYVEEGKKYSQGLVLLELELANYETLESAREELLRRLDEMKR
ncbi:MAG: hypothetical protein SFW35_10435 [Chitinophagales bacterium]|nr:hypothetical protein [Chitinophagales bacterium]